MQFTCAGQIVFDSTYKTGYHTNKTGHVIAESDSHYVSVHYTIDSATYRWDMGVIRIDKHGKQVIKKSFNMFNNSYYSFTQGAKNFIEATPSSYFLSGGCFVGSAQGFILTKFNKNSLDTIRNIIYSDSYSYAVNSFIKFDDNKYYFIGNRWSGNVQSPVIFYLDSNLNNVQTITVSTSPSFGMWNAVYNSVNKKILLVGPNASGQYPNTFVYIDTLGNISKTINKSKYFDRSIMQVFSAL